MTDERLSELQEMSKEDLLAEVIRVEGVCKKLWAKIVVIFGPEGFRKMVVAMELLK